MRHQLLVTCGILLCPSLLHAQTPAVAPTLPPAPTYLAPMQPERDVTAAQSPETSTDRWYARPLALEGHMGFGTPLGFAGAALITHPPVGLEAVSVWGQELPVHRRLRWRGSGSRSAKVWGSG